MKHTQNNKRKIHPVAVIRAVIQLAAFILVPGLFITVFGAIGELFTSLLGGTFTWGEQAVNLMMIAAVFLVTVIWGRVFCGFLCSFGAMQDPLWSVGKHLPFRPVMSQKADRVLKYLKYAVLAFVVIGVWALGFFGATVWSPWTVFGAVSTPWKGLPPLNVVLSVGGALLLTIIIGSLFIERFFCKYLCPLGALFALVSRFRIFKIKRNAAACRENCRVCTRRCSMSVPLYRQEKVDSGECINCMKCTTACARGNIKADAFPAVSGTLATMALAGVSFAGTIPTAVAKPSAAAAVPASTASTGKFKNGTYTGTAQGFRGQIAVSVQVTNGNISEITVTSANDDSAFLAKAQQKVIPAIIAEQDVKVATVSGATFSSQGIIDAVSDALGKQVITAAELPTETVPETYEPLTESKTEAQTEEQTEAQTEAQAEIAWEAEPEEQETPQTDGKFTDGVYRGSGSGFRGTTEVEVTVQNGSITDITITSYHDDERFFSRAESGVVASIISAQDVNVATVSGATFSSNSIIEAVADALGQEFSNPNSSMGGGHRH